MKITYRQVHSLLSFIIRQAIRDCDLDVAEDNVREYCKEHFPSADGVLINDCISLFQCIVDLDFVIPDLVVEFVKYGRNSSAT